ncbi:Serine phosphatase RsbU [Candidatus Rhodobacter oscarellae]|uniref:Serine phosphatase RsbU n=1 Tax=Candidatus Rhodobacter oscarellae TaxID=1675527 RepID=A0A0J9E5X9_9RHOB|nr:response regulator [Candidatus Rhodobacter lobularis]KMW58066.1 Serine phosphatase RsbU [Candidatus Rhodobacter lobularis]
MSKNKPHCLLVDESEYYRRHMRQVLTRGCPKVPLLIARSFAEARTRLEEQVIGFIFMDNLLPDGTGIDFAEELSHNAKAAHIPVALVCDHLTPFLHAKAEKLKVRRVWTKHQFKAPEVLQVLAENGMVERRLAEAGWEGTRRDRRAAIQ